MRATLNLGPGVYSVPNTVYVGSMRMRGHRRRVVRPALAALKDYVLKLVLMDIFKKRPLAATASVGEGAIALDGLLQNQNGMAIGIFFGDRLEVVLRHVSRSD